MRRGAFERWVAKRKAWQEKAKRFYAKHWPTVWVESYVAPFDNKPMLRLSLAALLTGCASTIPSGLDTAQAGLGAVDLALDAATETYVQAHDLCARLEPGSLPACDRLGDKDEVVRKAEALSKAYDSTAQGLSEMAKAYNEVAPHLEAAAAVVKDAGLFSR